MRGFSAGVRVRDPGVRDPPEVRDPPAVGSETPGGSLGERERHLRRFFILSHATFHIHNSHAQPHASSYACIVGTAAAQTNTNSGALLSKWR
jgi:hypothetical protein